MIAINYSEETIISNNINNIIIIFISTKQANRERRARLSRKLKNSTASAPAVGLRSCIMNSAYWYGLLVRSSEYTTSARHGTTKWTRSVSFRMLCYNVQVSTKVTVTARNIWCVGFCAFRNIERGLPYIYSQRKHGDGRTRLALRLNFTTQFSFHVVITQIVWGFVQGHTRAFGLVLLVAFGVRIWLGAGTTYAQWQAIYTHHFSRRWRRARVARGSCWADTTTSWQPNSEYCIYGEGSYMNLSIGHLADCCSTGRTKRS